MNIKKNLLSWLALSFIGVSTFFPEASAQQLRIVNYAPSFPKQVNVQYIVDGTNTVYSNTNKNSLEIFDLTNTEVTNSIRRVDTTTDSTFKIIFAYKGNISNGIYNAERVQFFNSSGSKVHGSSFPDNILITYQVRDKEGIRVFDLKKECAATPTINDPFEIPLQSPSNAVPGAYVTNYLVFTRKEYSIPKLDNISLNSSNTEISVSNVLPGSYVILQNKTNLTEQTDWTSGVTNYIPVTIDNFNLTDSTSFTNITFSDSEGFYRAKVK
jgi:hypothetical protein